MKPQAPCYETPRRREPENPKASIWIAHEVICDSGYASASPNSSLPGDPPPSTGDTPPGASFDGVVDLVGDSSISENKTHDSTRRATTLPIVSFLMSNSAPFEYVLWCNG